MNRRPRRKYCEIARKWHPDNFSDSPDATEPKPLRAFLEFQLDQPTTNRRETEFAEFSRRLAQREICPNLVPQMRDANGNEHENKLASVAAGAGRGGLGGRLPAGGQSVPDRKGDECHETDEHSV